MVQFIRPQTTLAQSATVTGFGFWSGLDVTLTFHPAAQDSGVVFVRRDLPGEPRVEAIVQNRITGPRRTTLVRNGVAVEMVEHVLSALAGLKIDNCEVHVDQAEMPGMDGSSIDFVNALQTAGKQELTAPRSVIAVNQAVRIGDEKSWIDIAPSENNNFELAFELDYPSHQSVGKQAYRTVLQRETYCREIAPARTFVLDTEAEQLRLQGLGSRVGFQDLLVFDQNGPIENEVRYDNECARHKVLDMVGDFALIGTDIVGTFTASKSGHRLNSQVVFELLRHHAQTSKINENDHQADTHQGPVPSVEFSNDGMLNSKNRLSA